MDQPSSQAPAAGGTTVTPDSPTARYARLWETGRPDLDRFLADAGALPLDDLAAVLRADQRGRWHAGERVPAEQYVRRLPGDPPDAEAAVDLIYHEFVIRRTLGESPDAADYLRRFPELSGALVRQFAVDEAMRTFTRATVCRENGEAPTAEGPGSSMRSMPSSPVNICEAI